MVDLGDPQSRMMTAALGYAAKGWRVFPCRPGAKEPQTAHGFKDAVTHPDVIRQWFRPGLLDGSEPNIGLDIPENIIIFDFDPRNGAPDPGDFINPYWPSTAIVRTPGGGYHLYYRLTPECQGVNTVGKWPHVDGVDIKRGGKGYVLLPPSELRSLNGGTEFRVYGSYVWQAGPETMATLGIDDLAPIVRKRSLPSGDVVVPRASYFPWETGSRYGLGVLRKRVEQVREAREGTRNNTLFKAVAQVAQFIAGGELQEDYALGELLQAALDSGLDVHEAIPTIRSAYEVGVQDPKVKP